MLAMELEDIERENGLLAKRQIRQYFSCQKVVLYSICVASGLHKSGHTLPLKLLKYIKGAMCCFRSHSSLTSACH